MEEGAGCLELKSRAWGLVLPRCLPLQGRRDARPGDGARTPSPTGAVRHQPAVSGLGLDDDGPLPRMLVLRCEGRAWPSPTSTRLGAGDELHTTELRRRERWPGERVVVLGRKQVPAEHGEFAGRGCRQRCGKRLLTPNLERATEGLCEPIRIQCGERPDEDDVHQILDTRAGHASAVAAGVRVHLLSEMLFEW